MAGSYEEVNYTIRPAKQIERKMICEAIRSSGRVRVGRVIPVHWFRVDLLQ